MDWAKHTTVIAALVAAAGLGVTAAGTVVSVRVAEDQLSQSNVEDEERDRRQASRITFWSLPPRDDVTVIANRSLDPTHIEVSVGYGGALDGYDLWLGTVPPCTRVLLPNSQLEQGVPERRRKEYADSAFAEAIVMRDADSRTWTRKRTGELEPGRQTPGKLGAFTGEVEFDLTLLRKPDVKVEPLDGCESAG
ncbi:hypothetical protein [Streptomyces sp. bgisy091]|uniref:hypothetical protein n=1 Tax=Streptomyces sp. bgisy091 TaxID=3413778 RepID=UPI003D75E44C